MNAKRGFAPLILLVIIAVAAIGGGTYYYSQNQEDKTNTPATTTVETTKNWKTYTDSKSTISFKYPEMYVIATEENTSLVAPSVADVAVSKEKPQPNKYIPAVFFERVCTSNSALIDTLCVLSDPTVSRNWYDSVEEMLNTHLELKKVGDKSTSDLNGLTRTYLGTTTVDGRVGYIIQEIRTDNNRYESTNIFVSKDKKVYVLGFPTQQPKPNTVEYNILSSFKFGK